MSRSGDLLQGRKGREVGIEMTWEALSCLPLFSDDYTMKSGYLCVDDAFTIFIFETMEARSGRGFFRPFTQFRWF